MSASSPAPPSPEIEQVVREIRNDMIESRNLIIKTDNLIKNLGGDVRQITKRQENFEKRFVFNSVMSYVLFSVIIFSALYLAFQAQVAREHNAVEKAEERIAQLEQRVGELESELERRRVAEEEAYALYRLMEEGKKDEVLSRYPTVRGKLVNRGEKELLEQSVKSINRELAWSAFEFGRARFKQRDFEKARDALLKSVRHVGKTHYSSKLFYYLGMSLYELQDYAGAVENLRKALEYKHDRSTTNEAVIHLAMALDKLNRGGEARAAYEYYVKRFAVDKRALDANKRILHYMREGIDAEGTVVGNRGKSDD
ncbi:MAG: hypothetical protein AAFS10_03790 [Myxococcota bacterium]